MVTFSRSGSVGLESDLQNEADHKGLGDDVSREALSSPLRSSQVPNRFPETLFRLGKLVSHKHWSRRMVVKKSSK